MGISEESRHQLHNKLDEVLGSAEAATLMSHLPPIGWADVATKHDLFELERRLDLRFDQVYARFGEGDQRFDVVDRRFEQIDRRLDNIDRRFEHVDRGFEHVGRRFDGLDERMQTGFAEVNQRFDKTFGEFRSLIVSVMGVMAVLFGAIIAAIKI